MADIAILLSKQDTVFHPETVITYNEEGRNGDEAKQEGQCPEL